MCGIAGLRRRSASTADLLEVAGRMAETLVHRGPNDQAVWADPAGVAFGFRRLAIIDLSPAGRQPMTSASGRYTLAFNGEIYNFEALRARLGDEGAAPVWRGHSDTEVLLAAIEAWGLNAVLRRVDGMFALALWDAEGRSLTLARDRFGEKPLYYGRIGDALVFASELKALRAVPNWRGDLDADALATYLKYGYVAGSRSIYRDILRLTPACSVVLTADAVAWAEPESYWSLGEIARAGLADPITSDAEVDQALEVALRHAVRSRMQADVPLGAFLSGGIDSSLVASLMQEASSRPVKTFTIGFGDPALDEAPAARVVAERLGCEHHEHYVTEQDALDLVPRLPEFCDEPLGDASILPTFLVARNAVSRVTVALSGDGGDELFFGYERYFRALSSWGRLRSAPRALRAVAGAALRRAPVGVMNRLGAVVGRARFGDSANRLAEIMAAPDARAYYVALSSHWRQPSVLMRAAGTAADLALLSEDLAPAASLSDTMMLIDQRGYLPDDILAKVDRACMAVSLEGRMPFLDPALASLAWRIPADKRQNGGRGKAPLRRLLAKRLGGAVASGAKRGFSPPILSWLRGPLNNWAQDLLSPSRLSRADIFDPAAVSRLWTETMSGDRDWSQQLWNLAVFEAWREKVGGTTVE